MVRERLIRDPEGKKCGRNALHVPTLMPLTKQNPAQMTKTTGPIWVLGCSSLPTLVIYPKKQINTEKYKKSVDTAEVRKPHGG